MIIKKLLQVDREYRKQFFDEWDRIFAKQLKRINQCIEEHRLQQVIVNHECPINRSFRYGKKTMESQFTFFVKLIFVKI
jgi:hypothetical protein